MDKKQFESSEIESRKERQRSQLLLSVFLVAVVLIAWALGKFATISISSFGCLLLIIFVFNVWHRKSNHLLEQKIKAEKLRVHQKKALRSEETAEWFNFILNKWYVQIYLFKYILHVHTI